MFIVCLNTLYYNLDYYNWLRLDHRNFKRFNSEFSRHLILTNSYDCAKEFFYLTVDVKELILVT